MIVNIINENLNTFSKIQIEIDSPRKRRLRVSEVIGLRSYIS